MTTETMPSPTPLADLAARMETAISVHKQASFEKAQADLKERDAFNRLNELKKKFREAVDAMRPKRPKKPATVVASTNKPNLP